MLQDVRHALRSLLSSLGFVAVAVPCLALGIGVTVAVFAVINAALLTPPPFADVERLVVLGEALRDDPQSFEPVSYANFRDWQERGRGVVQMAAVQASRMRLNEGGATPRHDAALVTPELLPLLGIRPIVGRGFVSGEDQPGADRVAMLSEALWRQRFGEDEAIVGRSIVVDGVAHTVVGIVPRLAHWAIAPSLRDARVWMPLIPDAAEAARDRRTLAVFAKLAPGTTIEAAAERLDAVASALESQYVENAGRGVAVRPIVRDLSPSTRSMLAVGFGAAVFVLLLACANAANLTLARTLTRRREVAVRTALGASRLRIVRQLLAESLVLGALAAPLGILLAALGLEALRRGLPELGANAGFSMDARTLAFTLALVMAITLLSGLAPALEALRGATRDALGDTAQAVTASASQKRLRSVLVIGEVALSLVLLIAASLLIQSFWNLMQEETVLDPAPLATLRIELLEGRYVSEAALAGRVNSLATLAESVPGVETATLSDLVPLAGGGRSGPVLFDELGRPTVAARVRYGGVTAAFFETLGLSLVRGRVFTEAEAAARSGVAIVNERMAERLWPGEDPLGKRIRIAEDADADWLTVIGVAPTLPNWSVSGVPRPTAYLPFTYVGARNPLLIVRASGDPVVTANAVRDAIEEADPTLIIGDVESMTALHADQFWKQALFGRSFIVVGAIGLLLAAIGLYAVLSHLVAQRTREIGLRIALGAARSDVIGLVLRQGITLVAAGVAIGLAGAFGLSRVMRGLLYGVSAVDLLHFAGPTLLLVVIGLIASAAPARRAAVADPTQSLRA